MTVTEAVLSQLPNGMADLTEAASSAVCRTCRSEQRLTDMPVTERGWSTYYYCYSCKGLLVAVTAVTGAEKAGKHIFGQQFGETVVRHKCDITLSLPDGKAMVLPGHVNAFDSIDSSLRGGRN